MREQRFHLKPDRAQVNELPVASFQKAIRETHGTGSTLYQRIQITESFQDQTAWEGEVLVFDLYDHPTAPKCYAWSVDGRVTAVLHEGPVDSPRAAVKAAIAAAHREGDRDE